MSKGVPSAHIATFEGFHLVFIVDARATSHYSFLVKKSCQSGFVVEQNNFAGESLGLWRQNRESHPV